MDNLVLLQQLAEFVATMNKSNKLLDKIAVLKLPEYQELEFLKIISLIYSNLVVFHVTSKTLVNYSCLKAMSFLLQRKLRISKSFIV